MILPPASFEPSIDYVVTKIPRFAFEKFPAADDHLTTQMNQIFTVSGDFNLAYKKTTDLMKSSCCLCLLISTLWISQHPHSACRARQMRIHLPEQDLQPPPQFCLEIRRHDLLRLKNASQDTVKLFLTGMI